MMKHKILFLAADPEDTDPQALGREARSILEELERSGCRDCFALETRWAVSPLDVLRELRRLKPTVVHFCGRGGLDGLLFQDADGRTRPVPADALAETFGAIEASVQLVVFSACYSEAHAEKLAAHVDCVVGMSSAMSRDHARMYAIGLYGGLGEGESIAAAHRQGCAAIGMMDPSSRDRPRLILREGMDAAGLVLAGRAGWRREILERSRRPDLEHDLVDDKAAADAGGSQERAARDETDDKPRSTWNIPLRGAGDFVGRQAVFENIDQATGGGGLRCIALTGLGGIGKTRLVIEYAHRHARAQSDYAHVLWVPSADAAMLGASFAALADALDLPEQRATEQSMRVNAVKRWLSTHDRWLLIFDDAPAPDVLHPYLPEPTHGVALITSRNPNWRSIAHVIEIHGLEPEAAVSLLTARSGQMDMTAARELAVALAQLPLALVQAAAYMEETGRDAASYLELFQRHHRDLLERGSPPPDYSYSLAATWEISFEAISARLPAAADLLSLCAFFAPQPLPSIFIRAGVSIVPERLRSVLENALVFDEAVALLRRYSLISTGPDQLAVHPLVQLVARGRLKEPNRFAVAALRVAARSFVFDSEAPETWGQCGWLWPHAAAATFYASELGLESELVVDMAIRMAAFWTEHGEYEQAARFAQWGLSQSTEGLDRHVERTVSLLMCLGEAQVNRGLFEEAEATFRKGLARLESLPADTVAKPRSILLSDLGAVALKRRRVDEALTYVHEAIAASPNLDDQSERVRLSANLGAVLLDIGRYAEAQTHLVRALSLAERRYGSEHPRLAAALNNLGTVEKELGDYSGAETHLQRALAITERVHGLIHPLVATIVRNLGDLYLELGDLDSAELYSARALEVCEQRHGAEHPETATACNNLGLVLQTRGRLPDARALFERSIDFQVKAYGAEHPDLAMPLNNLARILETDGDLGRARATFERALRLAEGSQGPSHPEVASVANNLGALLARMGDHTSARPLIERALAIDELAYGADHIEVATDAGNLGGVLLALGDLDLAEAMLRRSIRIAERHPVALAGMLRASRANLGAIAHRRGDLEGAITNWEAAIGSRAGVDEGNADEDTAILRSLGRAYLQRGRPADTVRVLERAREIEGRGEAVSTDVLAVLGRALFESHRANEAEPLLREVLARPADPEHPDLRVLASASLGRILANRRELGNAVAYFQEAVAGARSRGDAYDSTWHLFDLAHALEHSRDDDAARVPYEAALHECERNGNANTRGWARIAGNLGAFLLARRQYQEARPLLESSLAVRRRVLDGGDPLVSESWERIARLSLAEGRLDEAESAIVEAQQILRQKGEALGLPKAEFLATLGDVAAALMQLATVHEQRGDVPAALSALDRALSVVESAAGPDHPTVGQMLVVIGKHKKDLGDLVGARACFERKLKMPAPDGTRSDEEQSGDALSLANVLRLLGEREEALALLDHVVLPFEKSDDGVRPLVLVLRGEILSEMERWNDAFAAFNSVVRLNHPHVKQDPAYHANTLANFAVVLGHLGRYKDALKHLNRAIAIDEKAFGPDSGRLVASLKNRAEVLSRLGKANKAEADRQRAAKIMESADPGEVGGKISRVLRR
jgi:tetratricopeptide (TPR) repeat protein